MIQLPWAPALGNALMLLALCTQAAALYMLWAARVCRTAGPPQKKEKRFLWLAVAGQLAALFFFALGYVLIKINQYIIG